MNFKIFAIATVMNNKYKDSFFIEKYVALWAYGYLNGIGYSEGLYRTVNELGMGQLDKKENNTILDVGCGIGRTAADYANHYPASEVLGIDRAPLMIDMAKRLHATKETVSLDMSQIGLGLMRVQGRVVKNAHFRCASLEGYYEVSGKGNIDLVTMVNVIDRTQDIIGVVSMIFDLLKPGGTYIITTPLNFSQKKSWEDCGTFDSIVRLVKDAGFEVDIAFDDFIYQELLDARRATETYPTVIIRAVKPGR